MGEPQEEGRHVHTQDVGGPLAFLGQSTGHYVIDQAQLAPAAPMRAAPPDMRSPQPGTGETTGWGLVQDHKAGSAHPRVRGPRGSRDDLGNATGCRTTSLPAVGGSRPGDVAEPACPRRAGCPTVPRSADPVGPGPSTLIGRRRSSDDSSEPRRPLIRDVGARPSQRWVATDQRWSVSRGYQPVSGRAHSLVESLVSFPRNGASAHTPTSTRNRTASTGITTFSRRGRGAALTSRYAGDHQSSSDVL